MLDIQHQTGKHGKKPARPTVREITDAVEILRAYQMGLRLEDLAQLDSGQFIDLLIEAHNDSYDYPIKATTEDFDKFFGE